MLTCRDIEVGRALNSRITVNALNPVKKMCYDTGSDLLAQRIKEGVL